MNYPKHHITIVKNWNVIESVRVRICLWVLRFGATYKHELITLAMKSVIKCVKFVLSNPRTSHHTKPESLKAMVPHILGNHDSCHRRWCHSKTRLTSEQSEKLRGGSFHAELDNMMETCFNILKRLMPRRSMRLVKTSSKRNARKDDVIMQHFNDVNRPETLDAQSSFCNLSLGLESDDCRLLPHYWNMTTNDTDMVDGGLNNMNTLPLSPPRFEKLHIKTTQVSQVFFDIETTSLSLDCDILQISAQHQDASFNVYILPNKRIEKGAADVTGLSLSHCQLFYKGVSVDSQSQETAVKRFLSWLGTLNGQLILYGHNCKAFDCPRLLKLLKIHGGLDGFTDKVLGFVDTLHLFRGLFPNQGSYRQETLSASLLGSTYEAHNAIEDVKGLAELIEKRSPNLEQHLEFSFTTKFAIDNLDYSLALKDILDTLRPLVSQGALSKTMAKRVAQCGFKRHDLITAFNADQTNGIRALFTEKDTINGKVRVSANKKVIQKVENYFWTQMPC